MTDLTADDIIRRLDLVPHPEEGGWYRETWRCADGAEGPRLHARYTGRRCFGTAIYYLLTPDTISHLHKLASDEVFHFYLGDPVEQLQLFPDGGGRVVTLGTGLAAGETPQEVVPAGVWQGARLKPGGTVALLGCTVAPGFEFADYEHGTRTALLQGWPAHAGMIEALTSVETGAETE